MLALSNVNAWYDDMKILHDISFEVNKGENLCILGPNGCGKTTLLRVIAGLISSQGTIDLDGQNLHKMKRKEIASKIAMMSQISHVYFPYTVYEAVMLGRYQHMKRSIIGGSPSRKDRDCVEEWLEKTGLFPIRTKQLDELSGGQLQRVFLAQTMVQEPEIILLDEPTNHLDIKYQLELVEYLKEWSKSKNHTVIGVFHDINLALRLSDQLLFLKSGQMAGIGAADKLITSSFLHDIYDIDIVGYMLESLERWNLFR